MYTEVAFRQGHKYSPDCFGGLALDEATTNSYLINLCLWSRQGEHTIT